MLCPSIPLQHGQPGPGRDGPTAKLTLLQIQRVTVHPTPVATQIALPLLSAPLVRLDPAGSDQETWELFPELGAVQNSNEDSRRSVLCVTVQLPGPGLP